MNHCNGSDYVDSPYLAVIDDSYQPTDSQPPASYLDNTIGGPLRLPRQLASGFEPSVATCGQCGRSMLSLMQLSCPLIGLNSCRFLYFFLCANAACLDGASVPLLCLRAQYPSHSGGFSTRAAAPAAAGRSGGTSSYADWGDAADDWGDGEFGEAGSAENEMESDVTRFELEEETRVEADLTETFNVQDLEIFQSFRRLTVFDEAEVMSPMSVDQQLAIRIRSAEEQLRSAGGDGSGGDAAGGEDEQNQALTRLEQKFYDRLAMCPGQLLRYQWSGRPLLVAPLPSLPVQACQLCGAQRVFELQLMPGLLSALRAVSGESSVDEILDKLDLATALIFTCGASCQAPPNCTPFIREMTLAQRELPQARSR